MSWEDDAACRGKPTKWWFARRNGGQSSEYATNERAMAICSGCPVRVQCFDDAFDRGETEGIWGGVWFDAERQDRRLAYSRARRAV